MSDRRADADASVRAFLERADDLLSIGKDWPHGARDLFRLYVSHIYEDMRQFQPHDLHVIDWARHRFSNSIGPTRVELPTIPQLYAFGDIDDATSPAGRFKSWMLANSLLPAGGGCIGPTLDMPPVRQWLKQTPQALTADSWDLWGRGNVAR